MLHTCCTAALTLSSWRPAHRPRSDNPYLMLGDDPEDLEGVAGLDTELAVMESEEEERARSSSASGTRGGSPKRGGATSVLSDVRGAAADQSHVSSGSGAAGDTIPREFSHLTIRTKLEEEAAPVDMKGGWLLSVT